MKFIFQFDYGNLKEANAPIENSNTSDFHEDKNIAIRH